VTLRTLLTTVLWRGLRLPKTPAEHVKVATDRCGEGGLKIMHVVGVNGRVGAGGLNVALKEGPGGGARALHRADD
jgi:hypothetical protein